MLKVRSASELPLKAPSFSNPILRPSQSSAHVSELEKKWRTAVLDSNLSEMSRLLGQNPELVDWKDYISGNTALHYAAQINNTALVRLLAGNFKANVEAQNHGGLTPLHMAAISTSEEVCFELLSKFGAKASARDYSGRPPVAYLPHTAAGERLQNNLGNQMSKLVKERPFLNELSKMTKTEDTVVNSVLPPPDPVAHSSERGAVLRNEKPPVQPHTTGCSPLLSCAPSFQRKRSKSRGISTDEPEEEPPMESNDWVMTRDRSTIQRRMTRTHRNQRSKTEEHKEPGGVGGFLFAGKKRGRGKSDSGATTEDNDLAKLIYSSVRKKHELRGERPDRKASLSRQHNSNRSRQNVPLITAVSQLQRPEGSSDIDEDSKAHEASPLVHGSSTAHQQIDRQQSHDFDETITLQKPKSSVTNL